jgi:putative ABC transport system permease protein
MAAVRRLLLRLVALFRSNRAEADLAREIAAHLQLLEDKFIAQGMSRDDARSAARRAFGGIEQAKEHQRDARSFRWLAGWPMDLKLGVRMLVKSPGLTVIAVAALAVAIGGGAAYLEFVNDLFRPTLPIREGHRIVGIQNWDPATGNPEHRSLHDFARWRERLVSVEHLGAFLGLERNLITDDGRAELVRGVAISASAFRLVSTPPLLGRPLIEEDERAGADPVVVIGYDVWQARFGGHPNVVGSTVRLGSSSHTIVGVMPSGFGFPINYSLWVPLSPSGSGFGPGQGPAVRIVGRLAPGATLDRAQAELTAIALGAAGEGHLRPQIRPYIDSLWSSARDGALQRLVLYSINVLFLGLLGVCGANVATLVFARTATREAEITVRTALGASRGRIVAQLFAEALVLASIALIVGLLGTMFVLRWAMNTWMAVQGGHPPFWWNDSLAPETLLYAGALALVAAGLVGVVPALKATGPQMQARLKHAGNSGSSLRFGGVWTAVIVGQVALTVFFLSSVVSIASNLYAGRYGSVDVGFPREQYLSVRLELDRDVAASSSDDQTRVRRFQATYQDLARRLSSEPGVADVTYATAFPGMGHGEFFVEFQGLRPSATADPLWVKTAAVGPSFFETFNAPITSGRAFNQSDFESGRNVAIVDQTFVQQVLGGRDPIGHRVRQRQNSQNRIAGPWYEIVGVVKDVSIVRNKTSEDAVLYRPTTPGGDSPTRLAVHVKGDAKSLVPRIRTVAAAVDPTLRLYDVITLDQTDDADLLTMAFFVQALTVVSAVALLLSTAGVYALLSFTLARRTREIGIRAALGAAPRRIVTAIFSRAFWQVGVGVIAGSIPGTVLVAVGAPEPPEGSGLLMALAASTAVAAFILGVALLTCVVPARRALRIEPTEALRAE